MDDDQTAARFYCVVCQDYYGNEFETSHRILHPAKASFSPDVLLVAVCIAVGVIAGVVVSTIL